MSVELTLLYLKRIARHDNKVHSNVAVFEESALLQAQAADFQRRSGLPLSRLHGLPIAVKDLCEIDGKITTAGSLAWRDQRSTITAPDVFWLVGKHLPDHCGCGDDSYRVFDLSFALPGVDTWSHSYYTCILINPRKPNEE